MFVRLSPSFQPAKAHYSAGLRSIKVQNFGLEPLKKHLVG